MGETRYDEAPRVEARRRAERWTAHQAARLHTTPENILEAIRERAWLPEDIEGVSSKYALEGNPPELVGVEPWVDAAIERRAKAKARAKATGDTATAEAYKQAAE